MAAGRRPAHRALLSPFPAPYSGLPARPNSLLPPRVSAPPHSSRSHYREQTTFLSPRWVPGAEGKLPASCIINQAWRGATRGPAAGGQRQPRGARRVRSAARPHRSGSLESLSRRGWLHRVSERSRARGDRSGRISKHRFAPVCPSASSPQTSFDCWLIPGKTIPRASIFVGSLASAWNAFLLLKKQAFSYFQSLSEGSSSHSELPTATSNGCLLSAKVALCSDSWYLAVTSQITFACIQVSAI